eukprot:TRINITY_DN9150_c0_g1_i2.p1 TRINITY_DN9150_c0_g1~~TRINITY_DN9150_c0_g1_i2.p1  ORF type:complete len:611 (+),score=219.70 TRINITY_DN9150_c0_g1_i2:92-1834(+)
MGAPRLLCAAAALAAVLAALPAPAPVAPPLPARGSAGACPPGGDAPGCGGGSLYWELAAAAVAVLVLYVRDLAGPAPPDARLLPAAPEPAVAPDPASSGFLARAVSLLQPRRGGRPRGGGAAGRSRAVAQGALVAAWLAAAVCDAALVHPAAHGREQRRDAANRAVLARRSTQLLRERLEIEVPALGPGGAHQALVAAEEYVAQRRWSEAVVLYFTARHRHGNSGKEPALLFLTALALVHAQRLKAAQDVLILAVKGLETRRTQNPQWVNKKEGAALARLTCAVLLLFANVNAQLPNTGSMAQQKLLTRTAKASSSDVLNPVERSFIFASLAALQAHRPNSEQKAEDSAKEALALDPTNTFAMHVLGLVHMRRRNYARAQDVLKEAVRQDNDTAHQRLLVQCIWAQYEGHDNHEAPIQAYAVLQRGFPESATFSAAKVIADANAKKYPQAVKESNRTLQLLGPTPTGEDAELRAEVMAVRYASLFAQSHYIQAMREMLHGSDSVRAISCACFLVTLVCGAVLTVLTFLFGLEGCVIGLFGFVLLVLRGVFSMLLLSAIGSVYHIIEGEPFPVPNALMLIF